MYKRIDDQSCKNATSKIASSNIGSILAQIFLLVLILIAYPSAWTMIFLPILLLVREINVYRDKRHDSLTGLRDGRIIFFHALSYASLEILTRSIRRSSLHRLFYSILLIQYMSVLVWWQSLCAALSVPGSLGFMLVGTSFVGGVWFGNITSNVLTLLVSGGVSTWLSKESAKAENVGDRNGVKLSHDVFGLGHNKSSSYSPVQIEDDDELDDDDDFVFPVKLRDSYGLTNTPGPLMPVLTLALTVSFGSICKCAFTSGFSQVISSFSQFINKCLNSDGNKNQSAGFRGMSINGNETKNPLVMGISRRIRSFAKRFSALGLSHVAVYFKSFQTGSSDVSDLIESSHIHIALQEDLTSTLCSSTYICISSWIVFIVGCLFDDDLMDDFARCDVLLASFVAAYTIIYLSLEPLQAAVNAVYVKFAEDPQSLSHCFPIIHHRLSRITEDSKMV